MSTSSAARILAARSLSKAWAKAAAPHVRNFSVLTSDNGIGNSGRHSGAGSENNNSTLVSLLAIGSGALVASSFSTSSALCEDKSAKSGAFNVTRSATFKQSGSSYAKKKHVGDPFPLTPTLNAEVPGPTGIPSRVEQIRKLNANGTADSPYDILVIGGGATGAGIAFDAATRTNAAGQSTLKVACIERGDFASETSSRSTKLIWAGIKYLASAAASFLSWGLLHSPIKTASSFYGEFKMVFQCHQERKYMLDKNRHLTNWVPIVCPFTEWNIWPPPFGHWAFSMFPILAPAVFKFYDGLSQFTCPPSFIMRSKEAQEKFPQLNEKDIKYCAVFYEGQHNDARTNMAIAMTAAEKGADIANYVEMTEGIFDKAGKVVGVKALDRITGDTMEIYADNVIFAGGPFTDALRQKESQDGAPVKPAVSGASGSHIVLPGYYAPHNMGLLDYNTSDGRFLFFLPWQGSVIVGTTDKKCAAETLPYPPEEEIQWMLKECEKYLSKDVKVRRSDVLSSWRGWRPLASNPHLPPGGQVSRDHVISKNPESGVTFIAGGKWTTWREMAEDVLDKVLGEGHPKCNTLDIKLHGGDGYSESLSIQLIQRYGIMEDVAEHLVRTYGGRAWEVLEKCKPTGQQWPRYGVVLATHYPYIEAEVRFACQEYACTIEDILSRRTRLAFLNSEAAMQAIPRVADIMAEELGWSAKIKAKQIQTAKEYMESYGGRIPMDDDLSIRLPTLAEAMDVFKEIDVDGSGFLDMQEVKEMAIRLGQPLPEDRVQSIFNEMDKNKDGKIQAEEFMEWFNAEESKEGIKSYFHKKTRLIFNEIDTDMSGFIDEGELGDVCVRLGQKLPAKKIKTIFKEMDANNDGKIQLDEFTAWMDKETDHTEFRKMLSSSLGLGGTSWLDKSQSGGSFLG
mmetsp:Transcript_31249/g.57950  ORF Transcript_31249/g.57950 Transcript_31249/m.57950 type:complete len:907 (+) Transcript_31249:25-2745(+)